MSDYSAVAPPQNFSQSSAFAAALQRAKQIAAKINPGGSQNSDSGIKRPLEDSSGFNDEFSEPEAKKLAPDPLIGMRGGPMGGMSDNGGNRGGPVSSPTPGLGVIGRGGEQITRLQSETGCKIQMAPESGGLPERLCTLTGPREAVNRAKDLVLSIVNQRCRSEGGMGEMNMPNPNAGGGNGGGGGNNGGGGGGGPMISNNSHPGNLEIMIPGPKVGLIIGKGGETIKQLQEKSGAKMVVIQDGPSQEQEKPLRITGDPQKVEYAKQLVYELIAEKEIQMYNRGPRNNDRNSFSNDNGFNNHGPSSSNNGDNCEVLVPRAAVGVVIGKGGDMIKKIQSETGARVQFQQGREEGPGDRKCLLSGKPQAVEQARQRIQELIDSVTRRDDRPPQGRGGPRGNGFGGGNNNNGGGGGRPNEYGGWDRRQGGGNMQDKIEATYNVPSTKCGIIIGKGGETIKQINQQTGAHCELDRRNPGTETEKIFIIRGTPEQVEHAKRIFNEKLGVQNDPMHDFQGGNAAYAGAQGAIGYNPTWNASAGYQTWPAQAQPADPAAAAQPVQINPQTGQPDYSAQWAEYYRSLGMHREAELIEQQAKQGKGDPSQQQAAVAAVATPGAVAAQTAQQQPQANQQAQQQSAAQNGGQADYSAQWAEYYRSIGKMKEAEAIEAQMKAGKGNQIPQAQMQQQTMQAQTGAAAAPPTPANAFPQAYGAYPGMNPGSTPGNYYAAGAGAPQQPNPGQQNPGFPAGYQNYSYSQPNADN
ncbi:P-element somatic inhibitor isoform X2 [Cotesia typhae]|uniref:P-element somatic inhibitor isoform X2 n=1 Tax=Cotesia typhae TaxID=2053667 RepID=UPI003D69D4C9